MRLVRLIRLIIGCEHTLRRPALSINYKKSQSLEFRNGKSPPAKWLASLCPRRG
jgi:hypothetical protein